MERPSMRTPCDHATIVLMYSVLVLEDDALLRTSMARVITQIPETEVESAATLHQALGAVRKREPDLVVADLELPDGSGIELLHALGGSSVPFVFVSGCVPNYVDQLRRHPNVLIREKPMPMHELQTLVMAQLEATKHEPVSPFGASDYLQLSCMGRHSVRIEVDAPGVRGRIYVHQGGVWAAHTDDTDGVEAFRDLAFAEGGTVRCARITAPTVDRNIEDQPWEGLLLDAARRRDESSSPR